MRRIFFGALALLALVGLPIEMPIAVLIGPDHPVVAPHLSASLVLIGSCLLLIGSGLSLRREEAERLLARHPSPGA